jgi:hypothetical protein
LFRRQRVTPIDCRPTGPAPSKPRLQKVWRLRVDCLRHRLVYALGIVARHRRQQISADAFPDGRQRTALDATRIGMLGRAVDERRLQRRKKIPRGIADAILGRPITAEFRAQSGQDIRGAGYFAAADFQPLELDQKVAACQRHQPLQILLNPTRGLYYCKRNFPQFDSVTGPSRAGATARASNHERVRGGLRGKSNACGTLGVHVPGKGISTVGSTAEIRSVVAIFTLIHDLP